MAACTMAVFFSFCETKNEKSGNNSTAIKVRKKDCQSFWHFLLVIAFLSYI
jgi:hypothetical protein